MGYKVRNFKFNRIYFRYTPNLLFLTYEMQIIIIIIIIIRHELGLSRPFSASSNSLFTGLSSRLRPFFL